MYYNQEVDDLKEICKIHLEDPKFEEIHNDMNKYGLPDDEINISLADDDYKTKVKQGTYIYDLDKLKKNILNKNMGKIFINI